MTTDEEAIRMRQTNCKHVFIRGTADREKMCVHCGLPESAIPPPTPKNPFGPWGIGIP